MSKYNFGLVTPKLSDLSTENKTIAMFQSRKQSLLQKTNGSWNDPHLPAEETNSAALMPSSSKEPVTNSRLPPWLV